MPGYSRAIAPEYGRVEAPRAGTERSPHVTPVPEPRHIVVAEFGHQRLRLDCNGLRDVSRRKASGGPQLCYRWKDMVVNAPRNCELTSVAASRGL